MAEAGRSGIASDQQRVRMVEWVLLVMTGGHSVRMMRLLLLLLRDSPGTVAPGGGGRGRGRVFADRLAKASGAGYHLPAPNRK